MTSREYSDIIALIKREVVLSIGCTEPMAVSLCVARAVELLGSTPQRIEVALSANVFKNAMGVGIPNTGMTGLPIAIALGALVGKSEYGLEVLRNVDAESVAEAKEYLRVVKPKLSVEKNTAEVLYINVKVHNGEASAEATIAGAHTTFVRLVHNGEVLLDTSSSTAQQSSEDNLQLSLARVYEFATTVPLDDIEFIGEAGRRNIAAAELSFTGDYGHGLGRMLHDGAHNTIFGNTLFTEILSHTSGACDARMSGAMVPVMSNSGSGNQGISATVPIVVYARACNASREALLRALALSHLTVIYIKSSLGRLSALCGCVVAATGSSCGITYLMGGGYAEVSYAVKNMVANITGMICDGAKPSCSLKVTSGVATAILSATMAMQNRYTTSLEGIIDDDVDRSILNMTAVGRDGMQQTDRLILDIMTNK